MALLTQLSLVHWHCLICLLVHMIACQPSPSITCPPISAPRYGRIVSKMDNGVVRKVNSSQEDGVLGTVLTFSCNASYRIMDPNQNSLTCSSPGLWSGVKADCVPVCYQVTCPRLKRCVQNPDNAHTHSCVCPKARDCPSTFIPQCASDGKTYNHKCLVTVKACQDNISLAIVGDGFCQTAGGCSEEKPRPPVDRICAVPYERYYFNNVSGRCEDFYTGRCYTAGGNNIFQYKTECVRSCENADPCNLPRTNGPCTKNVTRYYYDKLTHTCLPFSYGGCYGNENNFGSMASCERTCGGVRCPVLSPPTNGNVIMSRRYVGIQASYSCAPGYDLHGPNVRTCMANGQWNGSQPQCKRPCPGPACSSAGSQRDRMCAQNTITPRTACSASAKSRSSIALLGRVKRNTTGTCSSDNTEYRFTFRVKDELYRDPDRCSFLPRIEDGRYDVTVVQGMINGCPCPYTTQGVSYLITAICDPIDRELDLHQESLFKTHVDLNKISDRLVTHCQWQPCQ